MKNPLKRNKDKKEKEIPKLGTRERVEYETLMRDVQDKALADAREALMKTRADG